MAEIGELRPSAHKGDIGGNFSDADSGFDDPGVITIPVIRTVVHNDPNGRKTSTTSTEYISVQKKNDHNANSARGATPPLGADDSPHVKFSNSISSLNSSGRGQSVTTSNEILSQYNSSTEYVNEVPVFSPDATVNSSDTNDFDVLKFTKEINKENENERKYRLLSAPRGKRNILRPTIREVNVTNNFNFKEETIRKVPKMRFRSKSADGRRCRGSQSIFSPLYTKILSPETMKNRKMWADVIRKDCILEEEYYKVPYEECNREIIMGRLSNPETLLYNFRRLRKERMAEDDAKGRTEPVKMHSRITEDNAKGRAEPFKMHSRKIEDDSKGRAEPVKMHSRITEDSAKGRAEPFKMHSRMIEDDAKGRAEPFKMHSRMIEDDAKRRAQPVMHSRMTEDDVKRNAEQFAMQSGTIECDVTAKAEPVIRQIRIAESDIKGKADPVKRQSRITENDAKRKAEPIKRQSRITENDTKGRAEPVERQSIKNYTLASPSDQLYNNGNIKTDTNTKNDNNIDAVTNTIVNNNNNNSNNNNNNNNNNNDNNHNNNNNNITDNVISLKTKLFSLNNLMPRAEIVSFQANMADNNKATDDLKQLIRDLNCAEPPVIQNKSQQQLWDDLTTYASDRNDRDSSSESTNNVSSGDELRNTSDNDSTSTDKPTFDECRKKKIKKRVSFSNENEELIFDSNFSDTDSSSVFEDADSEIIQPKSIICHDDVCSETNDYLDLNVLIKDSARPNGSESLDIRKECEEKSNIQPTKLYDRSSSNLPSFRYSELLSGIHDKSRDIKKGKSDNSFEKSCENDYNIRNIDDNNNNNDSSNKSAPPSVHKRSIFFTEFEKPKHSDFYNNYPIQPKIETDTLKKTNENEILRGDKVNIYMTKGSNFVDHTIQLLTSQTIRKPNVTVSRLKVPISSIRDQLEWIISLHQQHQQDLFNSMQAALKSPGGLLSPTPSYGSDTSSGCFSDRNSPFRTSKTFPTSL